MNLFNFLKSRLSILDVIGEYVHLKKAGHYYKANCPFHSEKTASFTVSPHKEIFYCFGCQNTGDVISFIARMEHCSQIEAARYLIERYNIEVPATISMEVKDADHDIQKKRYFQICKVVTEWCQENLKKSTSASNYFLQRGFTEQLLNQFEIGYFAGGQLGIKQLLAHAKKQSFLAADLLEAGILVEGKQVIYSPFEERLIFPIKDALGRHCGFGGRIFKPGDERAKYYNSRENEFFNKGSLLFGFDVAKKIIQEKECAFMVEGYTDCMAMVQHGYPNTIATLGTACTLEHLRILSRHCHTLYVLYDGDQAGQKAMLRLAELCWEVNLELFIVSLPQGEDPASFLAKEGDLTLYVQGAKGIFTYFIQSLGANFQTFPLAEKLRTAHRLLDLLRTIQDPLKQDILLQQASQALGLSFDSLAGELRREAPKVVKAAHPEETGKPELSQLEKKLFSVILGNVKFLAQENSSYIIKYFTPPLQGILEAMHTKMAQGDFDFVAFFNTLAASDQQVVAQLLVSGAEGDQEKTLDALLIQFQKKHWKAIVHDIKLKLAQAQQEQDQEKAKAILAHFQDMKKRLLNEGIL